MENTERFKWFDLDDATAYARWRQAKLEISEDMLKLAPVAISDLSNPTNSEKNELIRRCDAVNFAQYDSGNGASDSATIRSGLRDFAAVFGLQIAEKHRSAEDQGIVALQPSQAPSKRGYIPYSTRPMNWHTDGYYNGPEDRVSAFVLHCVRQAGAGGENQILDPDIVYIRLRDENPDYVRALMAPNAMTIPPNNEADGAVRPASVGPVFFLDNDSGRLQMRYTARTRSVEWHDDPLTLETEAFLRAYLAKGDPLSLQLRLDAGQGILNNNVLHNRTGFDKQDSPDLNRLIYRVRFNNRVTRSS